MGNVELVPTWIKSKFIYKNKWLIESKESSSCLRDIYVGIYEIRDAGQHIFLMT